MTPTMSDEDKAAIEAYAAGDSSAREKAVEAHRRNTPIVGVQGNLHQRFMAEVDTTSPDLSMRNRLRRELLESISGPDVPDAEDRSAPSP